MNDIKDIIKNPERYKKACKDKGIDVDIDKLIKLHREANSLLHELEVMRSLRKIDAKIFSSCVLKRKAIRKKLLILLSLWNYAMQETKLLGITHNKNL